MALSRDERIRRLAGWLVQLHLRKLDENVLRTMASRYNLSGDERFYPPWNPRTVRLVAEKVGLRDYTNRDYWLVVRAYYTLMKMVLMEVWADSGGHTDTKQEETKP